MAGIGYVLRAPRRGSGREVIAMKESILKDKMILAVDEEPDILTVMEEEILDACPDCKFHKATSYDEAVERIVSFNYDMVILDLMGVRGFRLAELAERRHLPVALLTAYPLSPEVLKQSFQINVRGYLPKERLGEIVAFLEEALTYPFPRAFSLPRHASEAPPCKAGSLNR
jgi:CheY-like chemotaxis protein